MGGVFISYRRDDSRGSAGRLYDNLSDRFGPDVIFRDLDALRPGAVYGNVINTAIAGCDALIAVIGNNWVEARDAEGRRRLDNETDLVRLEIATALAQNKIVVPVLVEDAKMPSEQDLPPDLASLASRNALLISDQRWEYDVKRLVALLDDVVGRAASPARSVAPLPVPTPPIVVPPIEPPVAASVPTPAVKPRRPIVQLAILVMALVAAGAFSAGRRSATTPSAGTEISSTGGERALPSRPEIQLPPPEVVTQRSVPAAEPQKGTTATSLPAVKPFASSNAKITKTDGTVFNVRQDTLDFGLCSSDVRLQSGQTIAFDRVLAVEIGENNYRYSVGVTLLGGERVDGDLHCIWPRDATVNGKNSIGSVQIPMREVSRIDFRQ